MGFCITFTFQLRKSFDMALDIVKLLSVYVLNFKSKYNESIKTIKFYS